MVAPQTRNPADGVGLKNTPHSHSIVPGGFDVTS